VHEYEISLEYTHTHTHRDPLAIASGN